MTGPAADFPAGPAAMAGTPGSDATCALGGVSKPTFVFFFPYRPPSGVSSLFVRLGQAIAQASTGAVKIVDFSDGAMARAAEGLPLVEYREDKAIPIAAGETLVLQAEIPEKLRRQLTIDPDARIIEWQLHPYNLVPPLFPVAWLREFCFRRPALYKLLLRLLARRKTQATIALLELGTRRGGIFFQDQPALDATEALLGVKVARPIFLPVPVFIAEHPARTARLSPDVLHVAWVGRLYDFKIHILVHTLRRFRAHCDAAGRKMVFHVVGSGPKEAMLAEFAAPHPRMTIVRHGDLALPALHRLLTEQVDVVASMGTAALEGAAIGLPVILLDLSYGPVPEGYLYRWLHQANGFEVGHAITTADCSENIDTLPGMLAELDTRFGEAAARDFAYVKRHHAMSAVSTRFVELAAAANLSFRDVPPSIWRKSLLRRLYERTKY